MSTAGPGTPRHRWLLAAVVAFDVLSFHSFLGDAREVTLLRGGDFNWFNHLVSAPLGRTITVAIGFVAALVFGKTGRRTAGILALLCLAILSTAHAQLFGSPWRHMFFSGACLLGWLAGATAGAGTPAARRYARAGALALLGAAYTNAGISKLAYSGAKWLNGVAVQGSVIGQDGLVADSILSAYRTWTVTTPAVAIISSAATVAFELAGPLMLFGGTLGRFVAAGLIAMHCNIYLLTTYIFYWQSVVLLAAFGLWNSDSLPQSTWRQAFAGQRFRKLFIALSLWATVAVAYQAARHRALQAPVQPKGGQFMPSNPPPSSTSPK